jgi:hypothetical protein
MLTLCRELEIQIEDTVNSNLVIRSPTPKRALPILHNVSPGILTNLPLSPCSVLRNKREAVGNGVRIFGNSAIIVILYLIVKELLIKHQLLPLRMISLPKTYPFHKVFALPKFGELQGQGANPPLHRSRKRLRLNSNHIMMNPTH